MAGIFYYNTMLNIKKYFKPLTFKCYKSDESWTRYPTKIPRFVVYEHNKYSDIKGFYKKYELSDRKERRSYSISDIEESDKLIDNILEKESYAE